MSSLFKNMVKNKGALRTMRTIIVEALLLTMLADSTVRPMIFAMNSQGTVSENSVAEGELTDEAADDKADEEKQDDKDDKKDDGLKFMEFTEGNVFAEGRFPDGTKMIVEELKDDEISEYVDSYIEENYSDEAIALIEEDEADRPEVLFAYDISFEVDGQEYEPEGTVSVNIIPEDVDASDYEDEDTQLLHVDDEDEIEIIDTEISDKGEVCFETDSFSKYIWISGDKEMERTDKYFSFSAKVKFADDSLINAGDTIEISLIRAVGGYDEYDDDYDGSDPESHLIAHHDEEVVKTVTMTVAKTTAEQSVTFSGIKADVLGGAEGYQNDHLTYQIPNKYYGIRITDNLRGYTAVYQNDEDCNYLSFAKDPNDAAWTVTVPTISEENAPLVDASFVIAWNDNRNFADKRPFSVGEDIVDGENILKNEIAHVLCYKLAGDDDYTFVEGDEDWILDPASLEPEIVKNSFSNWEISFKNLPKYIDDKLVSWAIDLSGDSFWECKKYVPEDDTLLLSGETLTYTYHEAFVGKVVWRIGDEPTPFDLPNDGEWFDGCKIYKSVGGASPVPITAAEEAKVHIGWSEVDELTWRYEISNLPSYSSDNKAIIYYVTFDDVEYAGEKYVPRYYNGINSTDTDKAYDEGTVYMTLVDDASMEVTKVWKDEGDAERRKRAILDGVTLYLWRYPQNKSVEENSPVKDERGDQYVFRFTLADSMDDSFTIDLEDFIGSGVTLPMYDDMGQKYVYNVTEVIADTNLYRKFYLNDDLSEYGADSVPGAIVSDGGYLLNIRNGEVRPRATKTWDVSAVEDYVGSEVELTLQRYNDGVWETVVKDGEKASVVLSGFTRVNKSAVKLFDYYPRYDENGKNYIYRVIETKVSAGGTEVIIPESAYGSDGYEYSDTHYECSAEYRFKGYKYKATAQYINIEGEEHGNVTNRMTGEVKLVPVKLWSTKNEIGSAMCDLVYKVYRRLEGTDVSTHYLDFEFNMDEDAASVTELNHGVGEVTFLSAAAEADGVVLFSDDFDSSKVSVTAGGDYVEKWVFDNEGLTVPAFNESGKQYIYTIVEEPVTDIDFYTEYDYRYTPDTITLQAYNEMEGDSPVVRIWLNKEWHDDNASGERRPVKLVLGYYDESDEFVPITNPDYREGKYAQGYYAELGAYNNWSTYLYMRLSDYTPAEGKLSAKEYMKTSDDGVYDREQKTVEVSDSGNLVTAVFDATTDASDEIVAIPAYNTTITRVGRSITVDNLRVGMVDYTFTKEWSDSNNRLGKRHKGLKAVLTRSSSEEDKHEIASHIFDTDSSSNEYTWTFDNGGAHYPRYDEKGELYIYSLEEYVVNDDDSLTQIHDTDTMDTTESGYLLVTQTHTHTSAYDSVSSGPASYDVRRDKFEHRFRNNMSGYREEVDFYAVWHDEALLSSRPDAYFTLYYKDGDTYKHFTGDYTVRWEAADQSNPSPFYVKAIYSGLPAADENGNVYEYFVAQTLHETDHDYETEYINEPYTVLTDNTVKIEGYDAYHKIVPDGVSTGEYYDPVDDVYLIEEDEVIVNSIHDSIVVSGKKSWVNVPKGVTTDLLPQAKIYLFRSSVYDNANEKPAAINVTLYEAAKYAGAVGLNASKSGFAFYEDGDSGELQKFSKYDEFGAKYTYSVGEIVITGAGVPIDKVIMEASYSDNGVDLTNTYKNVDVSQTNIRKFTIEKIWKRKSEHLDDDTELDPLAGVKATFALYRVKADSDGAAPAVFDPDNAELVSEKIVGRSADKVVWEGMPIYAPSGDIYWYYAIERTDDIPAYACTVVTDRGADAHTDTDGAMSASENRIVSKDGEYVGVRFNNDHLYPGMVDETDTVVDNNKSDSFVNSFNDAKLPRLTFKKYWRVSDALAGGVFTADELIPDLNETIEKTSGGLGAHIGERALKLEIYARSGDRYIYFEEKPQGSSGSYPKVIDGKVYAGSYYIDSVTADPSNASNWAYELAFNEEFPEWCEDGKAYVYYVKESLGNEYVRANFSASKSAVSRSAAEYDSGTNTLVISTGTVVNSTDWLYNMLKGSIKISKRWDDYNDDYELREGKINAQIFVSKDGGGSWLPYRTVELSALNKWMSTSSYLPFGAKGMDGSKGASYQYRILETKIIKGDSVTVVDEPTLFDGTWTDPATGIVYTDLPCTIKAANYCVYHPKTIPELQAANNALIVNKLSESSTTSLVVSKLWVDDENSLGFRPDSITVQLQRRVHDAITPKTWERVTEKTISKKLNQVAGDSNRWKITFDNLPQYHHDDVMYEYRAVEIDSNGTPVSGASGIVGAYESVRDTALDGVYDSSNDCYNTAITNTIVLRTKDITVRKIWNDEADHSADSISVALHSRNYKRGNADGEYKAVRDPDVLNASCDWKIEYKDLPVYNMDGKVIIYGVFEKLTDAQSSKYYEDYTQKIGSGEFEYCDKSAVGSSSTPDEEYEIRIINTPKTTAGFTKIWDDMSNSLKLRPASVKAVLQRSSDGGSTFENVASVDITTTTGSALTDGTDASAKVVTVTSSSGNTQTASVAGLPLYEDIPVVDITSLAETRNRYIYRFTEIVSDDYYKETYAEESGHYLYNSTARTYNTEVTNVLYTESLKVKKIWAGDSAVKSDFRPTTVKFKVQSSKVSEDVWTDVTYPGSSVPTTITLTFTSAEDEKTSEAIYYNKYAADGSELKYRAVELNADGTTKVITNGSRVFGSYEMTRTDSRAADGNSCKSEITNTLVTRTHAISAVKIWNDEKDHTGESISIGLYSKNYTGGEPGAYTLISTHTLDNTNSWSIEFTDLPVYNNDGNVIIYGIFENLTSAQAAEYEEKYYTKTGAGAYILVTESSLASPSAADVEYDVRIVNTPVTKATFTKKWNDMSDKLKLRPTEVKAVLQRSSDGGSTFENVDKVDITTTTGSDAADGSDTSAKVVTVDCSSGNTQTAEVTGLPLYEDMPLVDITSLGASRNRYIYRFTEIVSDDCYKEEYANANRYVYDTTGRTYNTEVTNILYTVSLKIKKIWSGDEAVKNIFRPGSVKFRIQSSKVTEDVWTDVSYPGSSQQTTITLTFTSEEDTKTSEEISLNKYDAAGNALKYRAVELDENDVPVNTAGAPVFGAYLSTREDRLSIDGNESSSDVTNALNEILTISVNKIWNDDDIAGMNIPITVSLFSRNFEHGEDSAAATLVSLKDTFGISSAQLVLDAGNAYSGEFKDLPAVNKDGKEIVYYIKESAVIGYIGKCYVASGSGSFVLSDEGRITPSSEGTRVTFVNSKLTSVSAVKYWDDCEPSIATRPSSLTFTLQRRVKDSGDAWETVTNGDIGRTENVSDPVVVTVPSSAAINGIVIADTVLNNLPAYTNETAGGTVTKGQPYEYRYEETEDPRYEVSYNVTGSAAEGFRTEVTNTLRKRSAIEVRKDWEDNDNTDGIRPNSIRVRLETLSPGIVLDDSVTELMLTKDNGYKGRFENLPAVDSDGSDAVYRITEDTDCAAMNGELVKDVYVTNYRIVDGDYPEPPAVSASVSVSDNIVEIRNTEMLPDGVLILGKKVVTGGEDPTYHFPFDVTISTLSGTEKKYAGKYYVYTSSTSDADMIADTDCTAPGFVEENITTDGTILLKTGEKAILRGIRTGYSYEITEAPQYYGYDVVKIEQNEGTGLSVEQPASSGEEVSQSGDFRLSIIRDEATSATIGRAEGKIAADTGSIIFTNEERDNDLQINNITAEIKQDHGDSGTVMIYKSASLEAIAEADKKKTDYVPLSLRVEFEPNIAARYRYGSYLDVYYWDGGDITDRNDPSCHSVTIHNYVFTDGSGAQVPYEGAFSWTDANGDGKVQSEELTVTGNSDNPKYNTPARLEKFRKVWEPLAMVFPNLSVKKGSVVITLANDPTEMKKRTEVDVFFEKPAKNKKNKKKKHSSSEYDDPDAPGGSGGSGSGGSGSGGSGSGGSVSGGLGSGGSLMPGDDTLLSSMAGDGSLLGGILGVVKTGDDTPLELLYAMLAMLLAGFGAVLGLFIRKKKSESRSAE